MKKINGVIVAVMSSILFLGVITPVQEAVGTLLFPVTVVKAAVTDGNTENITEKPVTSPSQARVISPNQTNTVNDFLPWDPGGPINDWIILARTSGDLQKRIFVPGRGPLVLYRTVYVGNAQYLGYYH